MSLNKTSIDWPGLTHTWNPGIGCKNNCYYCYARELHNMRHQAYRHGKPVSKKYYKPFNEMQFFPEMLRDIPKNSIAVKKVFVGSMTDICFWQPEWIEAVVEVTRHRKQIEFMFLTKQPGIYDRYDFPENCWLGTTVTKKEDYYRIRHLPFTGKSFVSIEPILGEFRGLYWIGVNLLIVGADSRKGAAVPELEWLRSIQGTCAVHYKQNVR